MTLAALLLVAGLAGPDSTEYYFARNDVDALEAWCGDRAAEVDVLHCLYRLYPLTRNEALLDDLPDRPVDATARSLALLSGLWGFRASESGFPGVLRRGLRAQRLLDRALELDRDDAFVLLVEGQSLLFKPGFAGGSRSEAIRRFERLDGVLASMSDPPVYRQEAIVWRWYALARDDDPRAESLRSELLADHPLPVFREMLENPPS